MLRIILIAPGYLVMEQLGRVAQMVEEKSKSMNINGKK